MLNRAATALRLGASTLLQRKPTSVRSTERLRSKLGRSESHYRHGSSSLPDSSTGC